MSLELTIHGTHSRIASAVPYKRLPQSLNPCLTV
jgi:hypothetical protein